jgi:transposase InsO family protein
LGRLPAQTPPEPVRRYEREHPGELLHLDIKSLARIVRVGHRIHGDRASRIKGVGWEHVHVCVDDASRVAYVEVLPTLSQTDAAGFLERAVAWFAARGVVAQRVLTDNGGCYRARAFAATCTRLRIRHTRTRPYRPCTNGKAERFIQTLVNEWAYGRIYGSSTERTAALPGYLRRYNFRRPHGSLGKKAPATRVNNLVGNYI